MHKYKHVFFLKFSAALSKTRQQRLKETCREQPKTTFSKLESDEEDDAFASHNENRIIFDSTTEQYKSIGQIFNLFHKFLAPFRRHQLRCKRRITSEGKT